MPIFQIDVVLDNDVFPAGLAFLSKREWEWSIREQVAWRGIRRGLSVAPARLRRKVINRSQAMFSPTAVFAGDPGAVTAASRERISDDLRVSVPHQVDVGVLGVGQHTPYSVDAPVNPILAAWQGLVGLLGAHTGRSLVRDGGAVIIYHPMPNDFSPLHHPSYVDFYADVLTRTADPGEIRADVEPKFAGDPWYAHLYRTSQAFHGVHPLLLWYEIAGGQTELRRRGLRRRRSGVDRSARVSRRLDPGRCLGDRLLRRGALAAASATCMRPRRSWWTCRDGSAPARSGAGCARFFRRPRSRSCCAAG